MKITFTGKKRVRFLTRVKTIADRGSHSFHFVDHKPSKEPLLVCSWCSRVNIHRQIWQTVEIAVTKLKIFEQAKMPLVSHGICNDCLKNINRLLDKAE